ncbi:MAG: two-component system, OmpR family, sensor kinase [Bacillota bacterium]|nr:two-component system, OmpR family, sensor kinase [Bacillota bacterium]
MTKRRGSLEGHGRVFEKTVPIRIRLTAWYMLLVAITLAAFGGFVYLNLARGLYAEVDAGLRTLAQEAARGIDNENGSLRFQNTDTSSLISSAPSSTLREAGNGVIMRLLNEAGNTADGVGEYARLPLPHRLQTGFSNVRISGEPWRVYTIRIELPSVHSAYVLQVARPLGAVDETLERVAGVLVLGIPLVLFVAALGGVFISGRALGPIDRVTRLAREVGAEDLSRRLNLRLPDDEVGRLARTFDDMLTRLEAAFEREKQFTQDAAHELRTPLTVMKGTIDVALSRPRDAADYRAALLEMETQVDRLIHLAESLLVLARAESAKLDLNVEPLDLAVLVGGLVEQLQPIAEAKGVSIRYDGPGTLPFRGDQDRLIRLFLNLLDNAVKHTPAGGSVTAEVTARPGSVEVTIKDTGPGIPPEHLPHIFERFYRVDKARSRSEGGVGLGLAIAKHIAQLQGGDIRVSSTPGKGSVFAVSLPTSR